MDYLDTLDRVLQEVVSKAERANKFSGFCIGNTSKIDSSGLYFSPIRFTHHLIAGSVIVYEAHHAREIVALVDGRVDYVLVDAEKKVGPEPEYFGRGDRGNIERAVRDVVKKSKVLTYKGNDLSVDSIDCILTQMSPDLLRGIGGKNVAIIGAGNLGSKLALRLVERGAHVTISRRSKEKLNAIVEALNHIKPERTVGFVEGTTENHEAAVDADIIVGMTNGIKVITGEMVDLLADGALIMDAGKGCLFPDAKERARSRGLKVLRVDIRSGFEGQVAMLLKAESLLEQTLGRKVWNGVDIVSGGLLAWEGEVVVDDIKQPKVVYGVADGDGDFVRVLSKEQKAKLSRIQDSMV